ncbi:MAG: hypothetical protein ACTS4V_01530 [Candidatus Hodgkinia cicadicola]
MEDALNATKLAIADGVVAGGGSHFYKSPKFFQQLPTIVPSALVLKSSRKLSKLQLVK